MTTRDYWKHYSVSALGLASAALALAAGAFAWMKAGMAGALPLFAGLLAAALSYGLLSAVFMATGLGPRSAVAERDRRAWSRDRSALEAVRVLADRLAALRISDPAVGKAAELASLKARAYLAACERARSRDPGADDAVAECLSIIGIFQKEADNTATERRYGLPDADPFADASARTAAALADKAAVLDKAALDLAGGLGGEARLSIKESL